MARSVETIYADLIAKKEADSRLDALTTSSKTSIWELFIYIISYGTWLLETMFDTHKAEVSEIISTLKPHTARWYRNKALAFIYGADLYEDTDVFNTEGWSDELIQQNKIIKYAAVTEAVSESRLIVKIATEDTATKLAPITTAQFNAFVPYIEEIKDAGVKITVINYLPDILRLQLQIYYDPLLLNAQGVSIVSGTKPVEIALQEFMKELPFNGELILANLIDKLQQTEGVKIPHLVQAQTKWINDDGTTYGDWENIAVKKIPTSGYFEIENYNYITYIPYS